ncbi:hypothetical protein IJV57_03660 [Candidatus Saccharibacteria bacterium]|nr:hypothetical protein [Candidatus Saccharibacteria bacterium]
MKDRVRKKLEALMPRVDALNAFYKDCGSDESFNLEFRDGDFRYNRQVYCYTDDSYWYINKTIKDCEKKMEKHKEIICRLNEARALVELSLVESRRHGVQPRHYDRVVEFTKLKW